MCPKGSISLESLSVTQCCYKILFFSGIIMSLQDTSGWKGSQKVSCSKHGQQWGSCFCLWLCPETLLGWRLQVEEIEELQPGLSFASQACHLAGIVTDIES